LRIENAFMRTLFRPVVLACNAGLRALVPSRLSSGRVPLAQALLGTAQDRPTQSTWLGNAGINHQVLRLGQLAELIGTFNRAQPSQQRLRALSLQDHDGTEGIRVEASADCGLRPAWRTSLACGARRVVAGKSRCLLHKPSENAAAIALRDVRLQRKNIR
jgi:hypothetical protein